ncbi:DUF4296 domain-containing protein [Sphingobacterium haloxyli]|nr:DUF4296 domain-containing protein [Sphingobacterium haloxyli]
MQRLIVIILSSFFLMISCNRSKPKGILSEKTMVDLMTDVHLVDGYLNTLQVDSTRKVIDGLYDGIFEKYGIDSITFKANISYYLGNPILSKEMYAEVTKKLNTYEEDYRRTDSLKNTRISDSIRVVRRYERLKEDARKLILDVQVDTLPFTYGVYQKEFMVGAELHGVQLYQPTVQPDVPKEPETNEPNSNTKKMQGDSTVPRRTRPTPVRNTVPQKVEAKPLEN